MLTSLCLFRGINLIRLLCPDIVIKALNKTKFSLENEMLKQDESFHVKI
jgi:hypothetical protein